MATDTTTVRVRRPDSERLQALARSRQTTVVDVVHEAVEALERREFMRGLADDHARLQQDHDLHAQHLGERQEWDPLA